MLLIVGFIVGWACGLLCTWFLWDRKETRARADDREWLRSKALQRPASADLPPIEPVPWPHYSGWERAADDDDR